MSVARAIEKKLHTFRAEKNDYFRQSPHSPLTEEQRRTFGGLSYFPYNAALHLELLLDHASAGVPVVLDSTTATRQEYQRAGIVHFSVDGTAAAITLYRGSRGDLFLPVRDATSGTESYGAGRYCEPEWLGQDRVLVDFNYLYNPYCAYNEGWSCPLPPPENWLRVPLRAGEKAFQ